MKMWIRGRSLRPGRTGNDEEEFHLDFTRDWVENTRDILSNICKKQGITSERRRLSYLNAFVKLISKCEHDYSKLGFTVEEILYCLRPALLHDTTQVRSGGLRALRYLLVSSHEATICFKLQYPLLISRSLDLITGNDNERVQALRVVRRLMCLCPSQFPVSLARTLVAIASGTEDRLINVTLGALSELCVLNPEAFILVGGVTAVLRSLCNVRSPRMAEALVGCLLFLQNKPETRHKAGLSLDCLAAPYTDLQAVEKTKENQNQSVDRFRWAHVTLLSTLRSWPGVLHFCHPLKDGLRSIVTTLYLNQLDVRKAVLDLLYELLCLAQPEWSDEMSVALEAVDPSRTQEAFKLSEGFVAAEGLTVLPHLSKCRVNLTELQLALLLNCFLEVGLLDAIVEVIIAEDTFLSVRATILLGELLHLIHLLLPPECCQLSPSLPNLLSYAVRGRPHSATRPGYGFPHPDTPESPPDQSSSESFTNITLDQPSRRDGIITRLGLRSGHSSVRTVSESSTDRGARLDVLPNIGEDFEKQNQEESTGNAERKEQKPRINDKTSHLLKGVREVLSDMTNAVDIKSPIKKQQDTYSESIKGSSGFSNVEPPACRRAQQRALAAVTALSRLHRLLRRRPAPASVHLDHVLASVTGRPVVDSIELARAKGKVQTKGKLAQVLTKECDEAIKDSGVLSNKDCFAWNWDIIRAILRSRPECLRKCEESNHRQFLRRLVQFVMPSSHQMSRVDFSADRRTINLYTLTAMELLDCLLAGLADSECEKLLVELLTVVKEQIEAISSSKSVHDCMFSPQAVLNSLCQDYFLLIGHLTRTSAGCQLLDKLGIIHTLLSLATTSKHDCYVKLIISSLDYSSDLRVRNIMSSTLVCKYDSSRLYATKFLRVLLRTPLGKREDYVQWVVELLANQLSDENQAVKLNAIAALDEACDCKEYLDALIDLRPSLLHLGDKGLLLFIRFLSTEKGFSYMSKANIVSTQLGIWVKFNVKYVSLVEGALADGLTLMERNEDGRYSSRLSNVKRVPGDVYVLPHLYGQLARHAAGLTALLEDDNVNTLVQVVLMGQCSTDSEILALKAALWALGHLSSSPGGALWARAQGITRALVSLCCSSPVYAIRSTAFHAIALTATNSEGADSLLALGWHTVRHNRNEQWPVVAPLCLLEDALLQFQPEEFIESSESTSTDIPITKNGLFILGEDSILDGNESFTGFSAGEKAARERKAATLPPAGSTHTYHHNRSYSESKADCDWPPPPPSNSGSDITEYRNAENSRLYSESSTSGTSTTSGDHSQPRTYFSEKLMHTLSPIPSTGSIATVKSRRKISVASSQGPTISPQDMMGLAALRNLHRGRRPTFFGSPNISLHFPQSVPANLSPLSPIELIAFQDWKQMSPLVRPKHLDHHNLEPQFEVSGVNCPLLGEPSVGQTLHYESSRSCIAPPPEDSLDEENCGPCYQGICLPQHLINMFPAEEVSHKADDPHLDNNSTTGMDVSSCDSETDTAPEGEGGDRSPVKPPPKRRHDRTTCLLCSVSRMSTPRTSRWRKISASSQHRTRTETESSYGGVGNDGESPVLLPWQNKFGLEGITSVDSSSIDITSTAQRSLGDSFKSRSVVRKEILRLAEQLCNPILYKTCKQALLQLKQMYGDVFNDICVYSDVCATMSAASHRICARRFLQELFLDAPFSEIYEDPHGILSSQNNNSESEDGTCNEKMSLGSEALSSDVDSVSKKNAGAKSNGFDSEVRQVSGPGQELEVIIEGDSRSECSEQNKSGGGGEQSVGGGEQSAGAAGEDKCQITVSKSSQQLRKQFFNTSSDQENKEVADESSQIIIGDSVAKVELETHPVKIPGKNNQEIIETPSSSSTTLKDKGRNVTTNKSEKNKTDTSAKHVSIQPQPSRVLTKQAAVSESATSTQAAVSESASSTQAAVSESANSKQFAVSETAILKQAAVMDTATSKQAAVSEPATLKQAAVLESATSKNNKSPKLPKKEKTSSYAKLSNNTSDSSFSKSLSEENKIPHLDTFNQSKSDVLKSSSSHKIKIESKIDSSVEKKEKSPNKPSSSNDSVNETPASKSATKSTKVQDLGTTGKPPSGSNRQRKKATSKIPNRDSIESKKKPDGDKR